MAFEPVAEVITSRRSIRSFATMPVPPSVVEDLVALACTAPAPHHSRPWRFVNVASTEARVRLADAMSDAWRSDLDAAGTPVIEIDRKLRKSRGQIEGAPVLLLSCLVLDDAKDWPDDRRQGERDMFVQSLGAALQNMLLGAVEQGLVGYLKGAPLFCQDAVREELELETGWEPTFLVLLGYPEEGLEPAERPPVDLGEFLVRR